MQNRVDVKYFLITSLVLLQFSCKPQNLFKYENIPDSLLAKEFSLQPFRSEVRQLSGTGYDLTKSLPPNYVKDASIDYTAYLQEGINTHSVVIFPDFTVLINPSGLQLNDNNVLIFRGYSVLKMQPNDRASYGFLKIINKKNITIYFPVLIGDRTTHASIKGEWGMGIFMKGALNVKIVNPLISNCWGDGIYIGQGPTPSDSIQIYFPVLDNNRRNGISITSAKNLMLQSPIISNTNGTNPASGIDIEPNSNADNIENIVIDSPVTINSSRFGIIISLERLRGVSKKNVDIKINHPVDIGSKYAFAKVAPKRGYIEKAKLTGQIKIINPLWESKTVKVPLEDPFTPNVIIEKGNGR